MSHQGSKESSGSVTLASAISPAMGMRGRAPSMRQLLTRHWSALAGAAVVLVVVVSAVAAPWIAPHDPAGQNLRDQLAPPIWHAEGTTEHLLGTDQLGRDILSRLIYGARISLIVGFSAVALAGTFGVILGLVSGYYGGVGDILIMRLVELQLTFPFMLLALLVLAVFGAGLTNIVIVLAISGWAGYSRVVRAEVMSARERLYVEAARSLGMSDSRLLFRHILPNVLSSVIVLATFSVAAMIVQESALSFLGLGIPPDQPSWGGMLADGRSFLSVAWWLGVFPGLAILCVVLAMNLVGDWLRDLMDPRIRHG
ncbi:MAG: peptide/nickel transport system permease protein [Thermomicrobiales bacterium]|nr:peptide/nickel transport system permease protein [Thermomicrobiales bacterium]